MKHFRVSFIVSFICLAIAGWWGYEHTGWGGALTALGIATILAVMEVSLSFDNAVVNAAVLRDWNAFWQKLFLTVGIVCLLYTSPSPRD